MSSHPFPEFLAQLNPAHANRIAVAFRGYNVTNQGKTAELLEAPVFGPKLKEWLDRGSKVCQDVLESETDLIEAVASRRPSDLSTYTEDLALIISAEMAQWEACLELDPSMQERVKVLVGYSLGEITATIVSGLFSFENALKAVLELSGDAALLAEDIRMGILFSRGAELNIESIKRRCEEISAQGNGIISISTVLSPNTMLLMGQNETVDQFKKTMQDIVPKTANLRKNPNRWPPLHTPIVLQKFLRDRAAVMLQKTPCPTDPPTIPIISCVTGKASYTGLNSRQMVVDWVDHPQLLWNAVHQLFELGIDLVIHMGPEPNIIPATLTRIAENVQLQLNQPNWMGYGLRTFSRLTARRPWLAQLLRKDAVLLRAPFVRQIVLEDAILEPEMNAPEL